MQLEVAREISEIDDQPDFFLHFLEKNTRSKPAICWCGYHHCRDALVVM